MLQHFTDKGQLLTKFIRRLGPTSLIVGVHLGPESRLASIKSYQDMSRLHALQEMIEHEVEAINGIGMQARWTLETVDLIIKRKKSAKSNGRTVN